MFQRLKSLRPPRRGCRMVATAALDPAKIRNMALVAHIDSGKTTLTESILLASSFLSSSGSVDTGSTTTDFLPAERERGITIQSASIPVKWQDWTFNLIDTPGHADFGMEVESASRVVDGAVVLIDSVEGVEAQTKGVWRQLNRYNVPTRIMFLNKLDRPGASFRASFQSLLSHRMHPNPMVLTLPIASFDPQDYALAEPGVQGLVDLVKWEVWKWNDGVPTRHPIPINVEDFASMGIFPPTHPMLEHLVPARTAMLENLSMFSEELMETLLELPAEPSAYASLAPAVIMPHLRAASLRNDILPVLCGAAMKHIGTELVMDYVGELIAGPLDAVHDPQSSDAPVRLLAWKVGWDKRKGWMTFVRVYSGTLTAQTSLMNTTRNQREKASKLMLLYANQHEEVDSLPFGSVGVILGLRHTRTGDTLVSTKGLKPLGYNKKTAETVASTVLDIVPPPAVISASVIPQSHSDLEPVQEALQALTRTDPSVRVDNIEGQILVHGLGALHLEIVEGRLRDEWDARFEFGARRVSYREGLGSIPQIEAHTWNTEVSGKPATITIEMEVRPMAEDEQGDPAWDGSIVLGKDGKLLPAPDSFSNFNDPIAYIARGLASALSNSPHSSLGMSHVFIRLKDHNYPPHVVPPTLTGAAAVILRNHVRNASMGPIMEPYVCLKVSVNEDALGKIVKDLTENGGEVLDLGDGEAMGGDDEYGAYPDDGIYVPPEWMSPSSASSSATMSAASSPRLKRSIHAAVPLSKMLDYSNRLRSLSGGHGLFEMANMGFRQVSEVRKVEILREIGRA